MEKEGIDPLLPQGPVFELLSPSGTWRSVIVAGTEHFIKVSQKIPMAMAATLTVNPVTAYKMMKTFIKLKPGELLVIMQSRAVLWETSKRN